MVGVFCVFTYIIGGVLTLIFYVLFCTGLDGPQRVSLYSRYYKGIPEGCDHPYNGPYSNFLDAYPEEDERIVFPQATSQSAFGIT